MSILARLELLSTRPFDRLVNLLFPAPRPLSGVNADIEAARQREAQ